MFIKQVAGRQADGPAYILPVAAGVALEQPLLVAGQHTQARVFLIVVSRTEGFVPPGGTLHFL